MKRNTTTETEAAVEATIEPVAVDIPEWTALKREDTKMLVTINGIVGGVQSMRKAFALVTTRPDATADSGFRGMKGNIGNRSKDPKAGCNCKVPEVSSNFLFAFIGSVPEDFAGAPQSGTICGRCDRAVVTLPTES
jgi:hypothetical protein